MSTRSNLNAGDGPVIVGYDGGPRGRDALALGVSVADALHSRLEVATVFRSETVVPAVPVQERALQAARLAREGVRRIAAVREAEPRVVAARSTVQGLHALAEAEDAAVLVVGTGDRTTPSPVFADTVATQLLSGARCPVAVAPSGLSAAEAVRLRNIGVAFDGSPEACTELQRAAELAQACGGRICVIHALDPPVEPMRPLENARRLERHRVLYQMALDETIASMPENVPADSRVFVGPRAQVLIRQAHDGLDLLVMGSRACGPARRVPSRELSYQLARSAPCPLLILPRAVGFDPSASPTVRDAVGAHRGD